MPIDGHVDIMGAVELVRRLYVDLGQGAGGPLHWVLDDDNTDDHWFESELDKEFTYLWDGSFKRWSQAGDDTSDERKQAIQDTCKGIWRAFQQMDETGRVCVLAWHWGQIERELPEWYAKHRTPERLEVARERADEYVREALAEPVAEAGPKSCTPVSCPPFQDVNLSKADHPQPEVKPGQRYVWTTRHAPHSVMAVEVLAVGIEDVTSGVECVEVRELVTEQCYMPTLEAFQQEAASLPSVPRDFKFGNTPRPSFRQVDFTRGKLQLPTGFDFAEQSPGENPVIAEMLRILEDAPVLEDGVAPPHWGPPQWQIEAWASTPEVMRELMLKGEAFVAPTLSPQVDVEQMLLEDAGKPPQVLYRGNPRADLQAMFERWLADPGWDADTAPLVVGVPEGVDSAQLVAAIALCQQAGLLPDSPRGILLIPAEIEGPTS